MSKNMVKLFVKLRNATFTPLEVQFSKKYFFPPKRTPLSSQMQNLFWRWYLKNIEKNQGLEKSGALQIKGLQKVSSSFAF